MTDRSNWRDASTVRHDRADEDELRDLMVRYQAADAAAVDSLVARLSPRLLSFFRGLGASPADAEDLLQECWIQIHRSRQTFRPTEPLLPWIFAIARHTRLDGLRRRRRLAAREVLVDTVPEHPHMAGMRETRGVDLAGLLACLPESQREVVMMLKVSGMTLDEVARATATTVGAVKQKAHRAYATLRARLAQGVRDD